MIVALAGGVGGAKLALGLARVLSPEDYAIIVNTADDFVHLGLAISPDLDTVTYTLAGIANPATGWGIAGDTFGFLEALGRLGGETWFRLGDRDLATHVERTRRLAAGEPLSTIAADFARRLDVGPAVIPMSDQPVRTIVETDEGGLDFQDYLVRRRAQPVVRGFRYAGIERARPAPAFDRLLDAPGVTAFVICPSNPFVSIDPILGIADVRARIRRHPAPVIAVSPLVGGAAVKGPLAAMMRSLGRPADATGIALHYGSLIDGIVVDHADDALAHAIEGPAVRVAPTVMRSLDDRIALARTVLTFAAALAGS
ncbi:MAG: 2-phospho-L-lactate transferase [Alphaproteobacteria bacterium]|nr:2-phospho-L-lactate transferase [Alphaproteobacteria bacterium]